MRQTGHIIRSFPLFVFGSDFSGAEPFPPLHKAEEVDCSPCGARKLLFYEISFGSKWLVCFIFMTLLVLFKKNWNSYTLSRSY